MNKWMLASLHAAIVASGFIIASGTLHGTALVVVQAVTAGVSTITAGTVVYHAPLTSKPNGGGGNGAVTGG